MLLGWPIGFLVLIYSAIKFWWRRISKYDEKFDEKRRIAEHGRDQIEIKLKAAQKRNDELLKFDPLIFTTELDRIEREKVVSRWQSYPEEWLAPLRPALGRAYSCLAKELLIDANTIEDVDDALNHARGALAADPSEPEYLELIAEIKEAHSALEFAEFGEPEIAALKLPRVKNEPAALIEAGKTMIKIGKYKVARLFSGRAFELGKL